MTTDEVKQLIDAEVYENTIGHITGTLLSSVLHQINEKRVQFKDFGTSQNDQQEFVRAFASALNPLIADRSYPEAQSALQSAILARLSSDLKSTYNGLQYDDESNFVSAIMNRIGYEYTPTGFTMFRSAVVSAIIDRISVDDDRNGIALLASAIIYSGLDNYYVASRLQSANFAYYLGQNAQLATQLTTNIWFLSGLLNNTTFISQLRSALGI